MKSYLNPLVCQCLQIFVYLNLFVCLTLISSSCLLLPLLLLYVELQAVQVLLVPLVPPQELLELLQLVLELLVVLPLQYELVLYDLRPLQGSCVLRLQLLCTQAFLLLLPCSCSCSLLPPSRSSSLSMNTTKRKKTRSMLSKLMKKISTPTSLSSAYILKTSSSTSSPNLK